MPWINHLPPVCWSTFGILVWNDSGYVNLTQWWYFFIIFEYILHISTPHIMIFFVFLYLIFLSQQVLYFLLSTLVLTLYIDVVLSLSIVCYFSAVINFGLVDSYIFLGCPTGAGSKGLIVQYLHTIHEKRTRDLCIFQLIYHQHTLKLILIQWNLMRMHSQIFLCTSTDKV